MCVTKRKNKQTMQCILHRETILLHGSFTLLLVFIPPSISKTWLKCSSYQHLCWTTKKKTVRWEEKWSGKVKSIFYSVTLFILHRRREEKNTDIQTFFSSPLSLCLSLPFSSAVENPPDTRGQPHLHQKLNSLPRTTFQSHLFSFPEHWYNSQSSL